MSKLRKSLKKSYSVFIKPSDEAIDWKKTAELIIKDEDYFSVIAGIAFPDEDIELVKTKFIKNANKMTVYDYYTYKKFDPDYIIPKPEIPLLKYVFEDFNLTDLSILFDSVEGLKSLFDAIKGKDLSSQNSIELFLSLLEKPDVKNKVLDLLKLVLNAKLVKCLGVDEGLSKEEIVEETVKELTIQDMKMLFKFIQHSLKLDVEKKNTLES